MTTWTGRPSNRSGRGIRGLEWEAVLDQIEALTSPGYTSYTPAWTATGTAPAIGNAVVTGRYRRSTDSDLVRVEFNIVFGTTSTYGTGTYRFSLPVAASTTAQTTTVGIAYLLDSGTIVRPGSTGFISSTTISIASDSGEVGQTVPYTWTTSDQIRVTLEYEPAA